MTDCDIRPADPTDLSALTDIWYDGWHEAHAAHVPEQLTSLRTKESFRSRLTDLLADTSVALHDDRPTGFCIIRDDEIYQIYVSPVARGTSTASDLLADAEHRLARGGITIARLDVIAENDRARAFYARNGWGDGTLEEVELDTMNGPFPLKCLVLKKKLVRNAEQQQGPKNEH